MKELNHTIFKAHIEKTKLKNIYICIYIVSIWQIFKTIINNYTVLVRKFENISPRFALTATEILDFCQPIIELWR